MKRTILAAALCLVLAPALAGAQPAPPKRFTVPLEASPSLGAAAAPVTVVEFLDFQ